MKQNETVLFDGKKARVLNTIGNLIVIWTEDGVRVVADHDVTPAPEEEKPAKKSKSKTAGNG